MKALPIPLSVMDIDALRVGDRIALTGCIFCGRDAVLPKVVELYRRNELPANGIDLEGGVLFHTAVSGAGIGPTSSNKLEIESSIPPLSRAGIRLHVGKGVLSNATVQSLKQFHSAYAIIPPVTALLASRTLSQKIVAFPELGMEAFHCIEVKNMPVIIAVAHGDRIL